MTGGSGDQGGSDDGDKAPESSPINLTIYGNDESVEHDRIYVHRVPNDEKDNDGYHSSEFWTLAFKHDDDDKSFEGCTTELTLDNNTTGKDFDLFKIESTAENANQYSFWRLRYKNDDGWFSKDGQLEFTLKVTHKDGTETTHKYTVKTVTNQYIYITPA